MSERVTVGLVSLGCSKNAVDAEKMLALLKQRGFGLTGDPAKADIVVVNTCAFIEDAKSEAIENILELAEMKKEGRLRGIIVTGCLAERYREQVMKEIPEVDAVLGLGSDAEIADTVEAVARGERRESFGDKTALPLEGDRILTTPPYTAYIKIAEGCSNHCTYCAIPGIRGEYRSRRREDILAEAGTLAARGVRELTVVAQDTTRYGEDLYGERRLPELLRRLCEIPDLTWVRVLYTYPERIDDELIATVRDCPKLVNYFDIPVQHCADGVLRRMGRASTGASLRELLAKIRNEIPGVTLRTTLMVGFPGETEEDFGELLDFVKEERFERLGVFKYSAEEDTPAAGFPGQIDEQVKTDREDAVMRLQERIAEEKNRERFGTEEQVLVEGYDGYIKRYFGRSRREAPEVDGKIFFSSPRKLSPGEFVTVRITGGIEYDLMGELAK